MTALPRYNRNDRVVYTGKSSLYSEPHRIGDTGTVVREYPGIWTNAPSVRVAWDNGDTHGHYADNIAPEPEPKAADVALDMRKTASDMRSQAVLLAAGADALDTLASVFDILSD